MQLAFGSQTFETGLYRSFRGGKRDSELKCEHIKDFCQCAQCHILALFSTLGNIPKEKASLSLAIIYCRLNL